MAEHNDFFRSYERAVSPNNAQHQKSPSKASFLSLRASSPVKFMYLNIRPRSSYMTAPSTKKIARPDSTSTHLGPGRYQASNHSPGPSFEFSRGSRFGESSNQSYDLAQILRHRHQSSETKEAIAKKIEENKDMSKYSQDKRIERVKSLSRRQQIRSDIARQAKESILISNKKEKQDQLEEKFKKYDLRMRKNEVFRVRLSWVAILSM